MMERRKDNKTEKEKKIRLNRPGSYSEGEEKPRTITTKEENDRQKTYTTKNTARTDYHSDEHTPAHNNEYLGLTKSSSPYFKKFHNMVNIESFLV